jgi:hypothetical protein
VQIGSKIEVRVNFDNTIDLYKGDQRLKYKKIDKNIKKEPKPKTLIEEIMEEHRPPVKKPASDHPWRRSFSKK